MSFVRFSFPLFPPPMVSSEKSCLLVFLARLEQLQPQRRGVQAVAVSRWVLEELHSCAAPTVYESTTCACLSSATIMDIERRQWPGAHTCSFRLWTAKTHRAPKIASASCRDFLSQMSPSPAKPQRERIFPCKFAKRIAIVARNNHKALWREGHVWGPQQSLQLFHLRQRIAIAIATFGAPRRGVPTNSD